MLNSSGLILQISERIGLSVVGGGGEGVFFKNFIASTGLGVDDNFKMIAGKVKGMDPKYMWEIIGIYRDPMEDILAIERLAART